MKDLLNYILKQILPTQDYTIVENIDGEHSNFIIQAPKELMGMIIGKEGHTIKALRNLLKVRATLEKKGVTLTAEEK